MAATRCVSYTDLERLAAREFDSDILGAPVASALFEAWEEAGGEPDHPNTANVPAHDVSVALGRFAHELARLAHAIDHITKGVPDGATD